MFNVNQSKLVFLLIVSAVMSGCGIYPPYNFKHDEKRVKVYTFGATSLTMCKNDKMYLVENLEGKNYTFVPAGKRISLGDIIDFNETVGSMIYSSSCNPDISFIPVEGQTYIAHSYFTTQKCFMEVLRLDNSALNGVRVEPSVERSRCSKRPATTVGQN